MIRTEGDEVEPIEAHSSGLIGRIVSTEFAARTLINFGSVAIGVAGAGVVVWGVLTYLQWHQVNQQGAPATDQALAALGEFAILLISALLVAAGFMCRMLGTWVRYRLAIDDFDTDEDEPAHEPAHEPTSEPTPGAARGEEPYLPES